MTEWSTIGYLRSPFKEKFAIPRQPGLIDATMTIELVAPYNHPDAVRGLEQFSHLWLLFVFHQTADQQWRPLVRPPRLGGNKKVGVFATRSTFRPNPIGQSLVQLIDVDIQGGVRITVQGADLVDGTPILDIKPYLPWVEACPQARAGFAQDAPAAPLTVTFSPQASAQCNNAQQRYPQLPSLIIQTLSQDPRPAYKQQQQDEREYGVHLYDHNIRFQITGNTVEVTAVLPIEKAE